MAEKKKAAAPIRNGSAAQPNRRFIDKHTDNSAAAQRAKILKRLLDGPLTTLEARRPPLDVLHPAARVHELRHQAGHNIVMVWISEATDAGRMHRVAQYALLPGKWRQS